MELTYEQHIELLKLANYLAKLKVSSAQKGIELDSMADDSNSSEFVTYVGNPDRKSIYQKEGSVSNLEIQKA